MTEAEKVIMLRGMTNGRESDEVLSFYLGVAKRKMLNRMYPFKQDTSGLELPAKYASLQIEIAVVLMNRRGVQGEVSHNENGVSRNYGTADVPPALLAEITPVCAIPE